MIAQARILLCLLAAVPFVAHGQPSTLSGLSATPGDASATLRWNDPSDSSITGYSVRHATSMSAFASATPPAWAAITGSTADTTTHTVSGLANGARHYFQVRATNGDGDGAAAQAAITLATAPTSAVNIPDANLRSRLESALSKSAGATITQLDMAKLTSLDAWRASISTLTGLEHALNLNYLLLSSNSISDVSALATLTSLTYLYLDRNSISDVSALGKLTSLTELDLGDNNSISDVSALGTLTSLTELDLGLNLISDVSALGTLTSLTELNLGGNYITDVSALGTLTSLTELYLGGNYIRDVSTIGTLTSLTYLTLGTNWISDVSALGTLTSLTYLSLGNNSISDVSALGTLTKLTYLYLSNCGAISDVSALGTLTKLTTLALNSNSISDVSALATLTKLTYLNLEYNPISDVSALATLTSLTYLDLNNISIPNTGISDVSALGKLTSLTNLVLGYNSISDVSALATLTSLTYLDLYGNSISDVSALGKLTKLTGLDLRVNSIANIAPLAMETTFQESLFGNAPLLLLQGNPLSAESVGAHIPALQAKGVDVRFDRYSVRDAPSAPADLVATLDGAGRATLAWTRAYDLPGYVDSYELRHGAHAAALGDWTAMAGSDGATSGHEMSGLAGGGSHVFELRAVNTFGAGPAARATATLPDASDAAAPAPAMAGWSGELRAAVVRALGKDAAMVTEDDLLALKELDAEDAGIADLEGIERLPALEQLSLAGNRVGDLTPLASLAALAELDLSRNGIEDVSALGGLVSLETLRLSGNRIADASPLVRLSSLRRLWLNDNALTRLPRLARLGSLEWLHAARNRIEALPAGGLAAVRRLRLTGNRIADLEPLLGHDGLREGAVLGVRDNPLSAASIEEHLPALRARGVAVLAGAPLPFFPSASDPSGREGFARVLNRSESAGEVLIEAVDGAGVRFGPARLAIGAGAAAHFNSGDLESGNAAKGLRDGLGAPSVAGGWQLALLSTLDIDALAYARAADGFVTSVHDALPRDAGLLRAAVFNPGGNLAQRSSLRLSNPGGETEGVSVRGVDDAGRGRLATGLSVPAGGVLTVGAAELERGSTDAVGRGLGDGAGKWRLNVHADWPVEAVGLLTSPNGHLTNLSTVPAADADGVWRVPLFPAAAGAGRQGFVRVANLSDQAGEVRVRAADDGGNRVGPVSLALDALETVHFNSDDWTWGNAEKGFRAGAGAPSRGDWRLALASDLNIQVTAFVRHADGFLTSIHDAAPRRSAGSAARVVFFNPGSNHNQASLLRLVNDGEAAAAVAISAVDDAGAPGGEVAVRVPAGEALTLTAAELEAGGPEFEGALGDGDGKWRLTVTADAPITVMSLLRSGSGYLTNLSSAPRGR